MVLDWDEAQKLHIKLILSHIPVGLNTDVSH